MIPSAAHMRNWARGGWTMRSLASDSRGKNSAMIGDRATKGLLHTPRVNFHGPCPFPDVTGRFTENGSRAASAVLTENWTLGRATFCIPLKFRAGSQFGLPFLRLLLGSVKCSAKYKILHHRQCCFRCIPYISHKLGRQIGIEPWTHMFRHSSRRRLSN
jgi:hypothetical protein